MKENMNAEEAYKLYTDTTSERDVPISESDFMDAYKNDPDSVISLVLSYESVLLKIPMDTIPE